MTDWTYHIPCDKCRKPMIQLSRNETESVYECPRCGIQETINLGELDASPGWKPSKVENNNHQTK